MHWMVWIWGKKVVEITVRHYAIWVISGLFFRFLR